MDAMEVVTSDDELEDTNNETEEVSTETEQTGSNVVEHTNSPTASPAVEPSLVSTVANEVSNEVHEDMQVKLKIGDPRSLHGLEDKENALASRGDGALDRTFKSKDAVPSTSKVVVRRRVRDARVRDLTVLRPSLPRKSKEKAKQILKVIARGIVIPQEVILQRRTRKRSRRRVRRPAMKMIRPSKKRMMSMTSLHTIWSRGRARRQRSRSADSLYSHYDCPNCCRCNSYQYI